MSDTPYIDAHEIQETADERDKLRAEVISSQLVAKTFSDEIGRLQATVAELVKAAEEALSVLHMHDDLGYRERKLRAAIERANKTRAS